jgi:hypothetical protein
VNAAFLACTRRWRNIAAGCGTTTGLPDRLPPRRVLNDAGGVNDTWGAGFRHHPEEAQMVEVGDRVLVESEKVGAVTRSGVVTAVEDRLITVRWDTGSESVFVPSAGSLQVTGHESPQGDAGNPEVAGRGVEPPGWPILTMDRRPTAVLIRVLPGRAKPRPRSYGASTGKRSWRLSTHSSQGHSIEAPGRGGSAHPSNPQIRRLVLYVQAVRLSAVGAAQVRSQIQPDRQSPVWCWLVDCHADYHNGGDQRPGRACNPLRSSRADDRSSCSGADLSAAQVTRRAPESLSPMA